MPPPNRNAYSAYRSAEIETLTQRDLIIKLYQGAERFLIGAKMAMENKEIENANTLSQKAKRIFMELLSTLDFEQGGAIAKQLRDLYLFIISSIVEANLRKDPARIGQILPIVATLREGWEQVPANEANGGRAAGDRGQVLNMRL